MSLLKKSKNEIKNNQPELYKVNNNTFSKIKDKIFDTGFYSILLSFFLAFGLIFLYSYYINFDLLKILNVDFHNSINLLLTSIITLVSINLLVTNFLFTYLKGSLENIQTIVEKKVSFKFSTYYGFSIIISTLLLFFFSNIVANEYVKSNMLMFIFISFIIYILLIVKIYDSVFSFINNDKRREIIKSELIGELNRNLYESLLRTLFNKKQTDFFENKLQFKKINSFETISEYDTITYLPNTNRYLVDLKTEKLAKKLDSSPDESGYYYHIKLGQEFQNQIETKLLSFSSEQKLKVEKYYILKKEPSVIPNDTKHLQRVLSSLNKSVQSSNIENLETNLKDLGDIYEIYLKTKDAY